MFKSIKGLLAIVVVFASMGLSSGASAGVYVSCTGLTTAPGGCREDYLTLPWLENGQWSTANFYIWPNATTHALDLYNLNTGTVTSHPVFNASGSGWINNTAGYQINMGYWTWTARFYIGTELFHITLRMQDMPDFPDYWETCVKNLTTNYSYPCEIHG